MKVVIFVSLPQLLKGNSTNSTQESVYTGMYTAYVKEAVKVV